MRIFTVTGIPNGFALSTAALTISRNRFRLKGSAAPPPLRVTFGTGQPKFISIWSAKFSRPIIFTASPM